MKKVWPVIVTSFAGASLAAGAIAFAGDCGVPPDRCQPACQPRCCPCPDVVCQPPCEHIPEANRQSAPPELPPVPAGMFAAPPRSGEVMGETRGFGIRGMEITLPELRLRTPSIKLPSIARFRRDAEMEVDASHAPYVDNPYYGQALAARELQMRQLAQYRAESTQRAEEAVPTSAEARAAQDAMIRKQREYEDKKRQLEQTQRCLEDKMRELEDCMQEIKKARQESAPPAHHGSQTVPPRELVPSDEATQKPTNRRTASAPGRLAIWDEFTAPADSAESRFERLPPVDE